MKPSWRRIGTGVLSAVTLAAAVHWVIPSACLAAAGTSAGTTAEAPAGAPTDAPADAPTSADDDRRQLLDGVGTIVAPGLPGSLAVFGEGAFVVASAPAGGGSGGGSGGGNGGGRLPVIAAARAGSGRVMAMAHNGFLAPANVSKADTTRLLRNAISWLSAGKPVRLVTTRHADLATLLGLPARPLDPSRPLDPADTLILVAADWPAARAGELTAFVRAGGSLLVADTGWGWAQLNPTKSLAKDNGGNVALRELGLSFTTVTSGSDGDGLLKLQPPPLSAESLKLLHGLTALAAAKNTPPEALPSTRRAKPTADDAAIAVTLLACHDAAPEGSAFATALAERIKAIGPVAGPTPARPLDASQPLHRVVHLTEARRLLAAPADQVTAHPSAAAFPGAIDPAAPRVTKTLSLPVRTTRWHSTGLYAAPGETITVRLGNDAKAGPYRVRVGAHTDDLTHLPSWNRSPVVSRAAPLKPGETTTIANPFGGAVYIETTKPSDALLAVEIGGAVEAPLFVLGVTDVAEWKSSIRSRPAPWAELVVPGRVVLTFRSDSIREMDDPTPVLEHWKKVLDAMADLAGLAHERPYEERIVTDVQISAGYMHAGYPIMTHLDVSRAIVDLPTLLTVRGGWGFYHELGHNHQKPEWTFDGTGEVTNNVFAHYVLETVCGLTKEEATTRALGPEGERLRKAHLAAPDFARWQREPFLALAMYAQLHTTFGWEPFKKSLAEYRDLPPEKQPKTQQDRRDRWMVIIGKAVGKDLGPFFDAWGVPVTDAAKAELKGLPAWMPAEITAAKK